MYWYFQIRFSLFVYICIFSFHLSSSPQLFFFVPILLFLLSRDILISGAVSQISLVAQTVNNLPEVWKIKPRVWFLGWEDPVEKGMATHSGILIWWIPWTEEPGSLQSVGLQRIGHDWVTFTEFFSSRISFWFSFQVCISLLIFSTCHFFCSVFLKSFNIFIMTVVKFSSASFNMWSFLLPEDCFFSWLWVIFFFSACVIIFFF